MSVNVLHLIFDSQTNMTMSVCVHHNSTHAKVEGDWMIVMTETCKEQKDGSKENSPFISKVTL